MSLETKNAPWLRGENLPALAAFCVAAITLLFQAIPLFWRVHFYDDWANHVWIVNYYADHLRTHHRFPISIDVSQEFGNPFPLFYGVFFYPAISVIALFVGGDVAIRFVCFMLLSLPIPLYTKLFKTLGYDVVISLLLASIICASPYQLSNLYMRSAITEFVAYQALIIAIALIAIGVTSRPHSYSALSLGMACLTFSLGSHPITFYSVGLFCFPLVVTIFYSAKQHIDRRCAVYIFILAILSVVTLSPFIISAVKYGPYLEITTTNVLSGLFHFFPSSIDSVWGKMGMFYTDSRVLVRGIDRTSTPFMSAPFQIWLGLALVLLLSTSKEVRKNCGLLIPTFFCVAAIIFMSHAPEGAQQGVWPDSVAASGKLGFEYKLAAPIQFACRLSSTMSICFIMTLVALAMSRPKDPLNTSITMRRMLFAFALLACTSLGQKFYEASLEFKMYPSLQEAHEKQKPENKFLLENWQDYTTSSIDISNYPDTFYGRGNYAMVGLFPIATADILTSSRSDAVRLEANRTAHVSCADSICYMHTNIAPSAFQSVMIDAVSAVAFVDMNSSTLIVAVPKGLHEVTTIPHGWLPSLVSASILVMLLWVLLAMTAFILRASRKQFAYLSLRWLR